MPAYSRGELSVEAYLLRILAALCEKAGGELRIRGELVDRAGESTTLTKEWDSKTTELVLRIEQTSYREIFRVNPEKNASKVAAAQPEGRILDPLDRTIFREGLDTPKAPAKPISTAEDDERLANLEKALRKRRLAAMLQEEIRRAARESIQEGKRT